MYQTNLPIPRAYNALIDTARGALSLGKARQFALTWIAAARMVTLGTVSELTNIVELNSLSSWKELQKVGLPVEDMMSMFDTQPGGLPSPENPVKIVRTLQKELGSGRWDVLPTLSVARRFRAEDDVPNDFIAPVAELMLDLIGTPDRGDLWLPFDSRGLLTIRALRRGWQVNAAQMMDIADPVELKLLLAIEHGMPDHPSVQTSIVRDSQGRPTTTAAHVIAIPPIRARVRDTRLSQWNSTGGKSVEQFDRSESMAVYELLHRVTGRAVFLVPAGVLFTSGQDQRLREYILHRGGECDDLESVIALPAGVFSSVGIASALLVVGSSKHNRTRLVDLGIAKRGTTDVAETILTGRDLALGKVEDASRSCFVTRDEFKANNYVLSPGRYLTKKVVVGPNAVPLGQLCQLIRPPAPNKGDEGDEAIEVGIPELNSGRWSHPTRPFDKRVTVRSTGRDVTSLRVGDLLLSVKGTVGKAGLLGNLDQPKVVTSQSCVGLRVTGGSRHSEAAVSPEYLLMYLRSEEGQAQLEALKVGSTIQHVSITTLMEAFQVPVPDQQVQEYVMADYEKLCELEREIAQLEERIKGVVKSRWTLD